LTAKRGKNLLRQRLALRSEVIEAVTARCWRVVQGAGDDDARDSGIAYCPYHAHLNAIVRTGVRRLAFRLVEANTDILLL